MQSVPSKAGNPPFILASASPRRLDLLNQIHLPPDRTVPADIDESPLPDELPRDLARRLAEAKARCVAEEFPGAFVLAADTVVACGRRILPKGETEAEAKACLRLLSGRQHRVIGGIFVVAPDGRSSGRLVTTSVTFKRLERAEIDAYVASGEWHDKAGAYAIQGLASRYIRRINGSYSNVVGLALFETASLLKGLGYGPATDS